MLRFQICLFIFLNACSSDAQLLKNSSLSPVRFTDFSVDSVVVLKLGDNVYFDATSVQFSPLEKNKVWLSPSNENEAFQFDLKTGRVVPLGDSFLTNVRAQNIRHDPFDARFCWYLGLSKGVFRYDYSKQEVQQFEIVHRHGNTHSILFTEKEVWIGSETGLWRFDRQSGQCRLIENSPREMLQTLVQLPGRRVLANGRFAYDPMTACWEQLTQRFGLRMEQIEETLEMGGFCVIYRGTHELTIAKPDGTTVETPQFYTFPTRYGEQREPCSYNFSGGRVSFELPFLWSFRRNHFVKLDLNTGGVSAFGFDLPKDANGDPTRGESPEDFWILQGDFWSSVEKNTGKQHFYKALFPAEQGVLRADSEHLYFFMRGRVAIVSQKFLKTHREIENPNHAIHEFQRVCDSLDFYENFDWQERLAMVQHLEKRFAGTKQPFILRCLEIYKLNVACVGEPQLLEIVADKSLDTTVVDGAFRNLIFERARWGDFRGAVAAGKKFERERAGAVYFQKNESDGEVPSWDLIHLENTLRMLDSLDAAGLPTDVLLFEKAKTLWDFETTSRYFGSSCGYKHYSFSDSLYRDLLERFPDSELADDADFQRLRNRLFSAPYVYSQSEAEEFWQVFLKKYPNSNRRAEALATMAWANNDCDLGNLQKSVRWMNEAAKLRPDLFLHDLDNGLLYQKEELQQKLDLLELKFSIKLKKQKIKSGEAVELIFSLKNTGEEEKTLRQIVEAGYPNFAVEVSFENPNLDCVAPVHCYETEKFAHSNEPNFYGNRKIAAGKSLEEVWDLTRTALKSGNPTLVKFPFDQPGVYKITAFWESYGRVESAPVRLEVE